MECFNSKELAYKLNLEGLRRGANTKLKLR